MRFYAPEQIGPKQFKTPEGFLLCVDVPLARTGSMTYGPGETPITPGPDGLVHVERTAEEVFRPETIASYNGKPLVDEHPQNDVTPQNWKNLAIGVILTPRRGVGDDADVMLADLLVTDAQAILDIMAGKREVSCGYDAEYFELEPGRGQQRTIVGNHLALVQKGRCGSRCAIGDNSQEQRMAQISPTSKLTDVIRNAFVSKDAVAFEAAMKAFEASGPVATNDGDGTHIHIHGGQTRDAKEDEVVRRFSDEDLNSRFEKLEEGHSKIMDSMSAIQEHLGMTGDKAKDKAARDKRAKDAEEEEEKEKKAKDAEMEAEKKAKDEAILGALELEAPPGTNDARKARDSAFLADPFQAAVATAEIIMPGTKVPTFDAAASPLKTVVEINRLRCSVLDAAYAQPEIRAVIDQVLGGRVLDTKHMSHDALRGLFNAVGALRRSANNEAARPAFGTGGGLGVVGQSRTPADINRANAAFWGTKKTA